jgi:uncharacterized protein
MQQKYKASAYLVVSDVLNEQKQRIAYSTRMGKGVLITNLCYQYILDNRIEELPKSTADDLIRNKVLVDDNENELDTIISENLEYLKTEQGRLYEVIQPTAMCQLGCYYCGQKHTKNNLSSELIDKLVERIHQKFINGNYKSLHIGWFGAEPLMGLPQMRTIYKLLRSKLGPQIPIHGNIVSNGLSLKEDIYFELVRDLGITAAEITLDGLGEYHDSHRYTKSANPSFQIIYDNLKSIMNHPDFNGKKSKIVIRCNVDEKNVEGVELLIRKLAEDNLHRKIDKLYFAAIYSWGGNDAHKKSLTKEEFALRKMKWELLKISLGYERPVLKYERKKATCIATGGATELYDAFGNVFNCSEISYADVYKGTPYILGNLLTDGSGKVYINKPHHDWFEKVRDTDKFPCHTCKLLPICGGSCPKSWEEGNPACPPFKFSIKKDLELSYLLDFSPSESLTNALNKFENSLSIADFKRME